MSDWKSLIDQAMIQEGSNTIGAHATYGQAVRAALSQAQLLLTDMEAAQIIESIYGALVAYSQQVMLRMKAEDPEIGGVDHAFRAGQAYGVSCVLNHLIDQLTDVASITALEALDDFSDTLHNDILIQARAITVESLDAKGEIRSNNPKSLTTARIRNFPSGAFITGWSVGDLLLSIEGVI